MSDSPPDAVLTHDMWLLQLNIEAAVRCSKERDPKLTAFYANTCASTWAAHRAFRLLVEVAPVQAAALVDELEEELGDGNYMEIADERAAEMGIDVSEFAEEIRASLTAPTELAPAEKCPRCAGSGIDPEHSDGGCTIPGEEQPPALEPCTACQFPTA